MKTARGLNKKAVKSKVPICPPPSSTSHTPFFAPALRCLGSPAWSHGGISSCPRTATERSHSSGFSSRAHQMKYPSVYHSSPHQESVFHTAASLPAVPLGRCTNTPCSTCSHQVVICYVFAKLRKKLIILGTHVFMVRKPELHHCCATVTALDTIPKLSIFSRFHPRGIYICCRLC